MAVTTTGLIRHFRTKKTTVEAVRGVDMDIGDGELVALLGPNGAGKSTLFRMLTTLLPPTAGTATVAGRDIIRDPDGVRARIGYVGQNHSAGDNFRVRDELVTQGRSHGMTRVEATRRADEVLDLLGLRPLAKRTPNTLSGGQRRRVDIAMGLVHRPALLLLDEPSTGLDPHSRAEVWEHILRLREELAMTLVLSTHYLEEADRMAERVVIIDHGLVIADGTADRLRKDLAGDRIALTLESKADMARIAGPFEAHGDTVHIRVPDAAAALPRHLRELDAAGVKVVAAQALRPTLDDVFLALTGRSIQEAA
ncbi:ABC transporter [Actinosynnema sp. ALI-1.44]|uniref:ATP-binding cassette domain-containing protein n=1 Tax=Actinosynnema sp. ALI-1.44 TaxID=1933779 RepID=UPI00097C4F61|nr:ABC transporter ATP-binding protein [Actinosynnema sp. ALI-1.44]ONI77358.1 ABC transporter [Actinosynnema sp. ALI-1.44]